MLYIVATPIGNMEDISLRALAVLRKVDYVICEDTRHSGILLKKYEISKRLLSFHSYSGEKEIDKIVNLLKEGHEMAFISDAGTPGLSDPGFNLIQAVLKNDISITTVPGASALLAALPLSGLPMDKFLFVGFLPLKKKRKTTLQNLAALPYTIVLYEAPHRLIRTLEDILLYFGERNMAVCRELTKLHEEVKRGRISEVIAAFSAQKVRGEFVLVISAEKVD